MFKHGADVEDVRRKYNLKGELVDFSSNINPSTPKNIVDYINNSLNKITSYPDIKYIDLRNKISESLNDKYNTSFNNENICVGNGATELIFLLMKSTSGKVGIIDPTFSEYERAAHICGREVEHINMNNIGTSFEIDIDDIIISELSVLFICNPNNPDGKLRNLSEIVKMCEKYGVLLVVDETFIEFCMDEEVYSLLKSSYKNIFILRAITKIYGLPGLRFGYGISPDSELISRLWENKEPWTVNTIAENVTMDILDNDEFIRNTKISYDVEREFLVSNLNGIKSLIVYESNSAFILIKIKDSNRINSDMLREKLIINYGIIIRNASSFNGLDNSFLRVAVKNREDNIRLINALKEIFN